MAMGTFYAYGGNSKPRVVPEQVPAQNTGVMSKVRSIMTKPFVTEQAYVHSPSVDERKEESLPPFRSMFTLNFDNESNNETDSPTVNIPLEKFRNLVELEKRVDFLRPFLSSEKIDVGDESELKNRASQMMKEFPDFDLETCADCYLFNLVLNIATGVELPLKMYRVGNLVFVDRNVIRMLYTRDKKGSPVMTMHTTEMDIELYTGLMRGFNRSISDAYMEAVFGEEQSTMDLLATKYKLFNDSNYKELKKQKHSWTYDELLMTMYIIHMVSNTTDTNCAIDELSWFNSLDEIRKKVGERSKYLKLLCVVGRIGKTACGLMDNMLSSSKHNSNSFWGTSQNSLLQKISKLSRSDYILRYINHPHQQDIDTSETIYLFKEHMVYKKDAEWFIRNNAHFIDSEDPTKIPSHLINNQSKIKIDKLVTDLLLTCSGTEDSRTASSIDRYNILNFCKITADTINDVESLQVFKPDSNFKGIFIPFVEKEDYMIARAVSFLERKKASKNAAKVNVTSFRDYDVMSDFTTSQIPIHDSVYAEIRELFKLGVKNKNVLELLSTRITHKSDPLFISLISSTKENEQNPEEPKEDDPEEPKEDDPEEPEDPKKGDDPEEPEDPKNDDPEEPEDPKNDDPEEPEDPKKGDDPEEPVDPKEDDPEEPVDPKNDDPDDPEEPKEDDPEEPVDPKNDDPEEPVDPKNDDPEDPKEDDPEEPDDPKEDDPEEPKNEDPEEPDDPKEDDPEDSKNEDEFKDAVEYQPESSEGNFDKIILAIDDSYRVYHHFREKALVNVHDLKPSLFKNN